MAGQLTIDNLKASSGVLATQNGMTGIAKAWVQIAGSTGAIVGSFNISSVTRVSTGVYTVNITTAMTNANYATAIGCSGDTTGGGAMAYLTWNVTPTTTSLQLSTCRTNNTSQDTTIVCATIFGA